MPVVLGQLLLADAALRLELVGNVGSLLNQLLLVGKVDVGVVLLGRRDPAVTDEEALELPLVLGRRLLVALEDRLGDVRDVLAGKRLAREIQLDHR